MSQTSINPAGQPIAVAGQAVDTGEGADDVSRFNGESSSAIGFGLGVKPGTYDHDVKLPTTGCTFGGVTMWSAAHVPGASNGDLDTTSTPPGIKIKGRIDVRRRGRIWAQVDADTSITPGVTRAYLRFESDGVSNTLVGTFRHSDDGHVVDVRKQAVFVSGVRTAADGSKIAELDILAAASA